MITQIFDNLIWYEYKGDEIAWTGSVYYSLMTCGSFMTLKEMDDFWEDMYEIGRGEQNGNKSS